MAHFGQTRICCSKNSKSSEMAHFNKKEYSAAQKHKHTSILSTTSNYVISLAATERETCLCQKADFKKIQEVSHDMHALTFRTGKGISFFFLWSSGSWSTTDCVLCKYLAQTADNHRV
jgi:hypothetical protein